MKTSYVNGVVTIELDAPEIFLLEHLLDGDYDEVMSMVSAPILDSLARAKNDLLQQAIGKGKVVDFGNLATELANASAHSDYETMPAMQERLRNEILTARAADIEARRLGATEAAAAKRAASKLAAEKEAV